MNQLFRIMCRWLRHDKKRTLLTFASITLSVFLISFVGFYMNTGLNALHAKCMYDDPSHVTLNPKTIEQVRTLDNNAAWENHWVYTESYLFADKSTKEKVLAAGGKFPDVTINGTSIYDSIETNVTMSLEGSDGKPLEGTDTVPCNAPGAPHEVVVGAVAARRFGLEKGGSMTLRLTAREGKLFYGEFTEDTEESGFSSEPEEDENGVIYHEDTDGSKLTEIYGLLDELCESSDRPYGYVDFFRRRIYGKKHYSGTWGIENTVFPPVYAEFTGEPRVLYEYTATVKDITEEDGENIIFYIYDSDILPAFGDPENLDIDYHARVKTDIDAESAAIRAAKGIGIYTNENKGYGINAELLVLEGRQLEYIEGVMWFFALFIIVMGLFIFLARLIINNAFEISAAYRTEQYGALKTIGASDGQIFTMIMIECALYLAAALPVGTGLAILAGKSLLEKIRDIKIFDPVHGEGISDTFFVFRLSPLVMGITFACALFSVFFSAYGDALRVKRMPPIRSAGYSSSKRRIKKSGRWLSRRLFGYPFGFAVKCISKQKVRFAVTLAAAILSGIFIIGISGIAKARSDKLKEEERYAPYRYDIEVWSDDDGEPDIGKSVEKIKGHYEALRDSGCFEDIYINAFTIVQGSDEDELNGMLSDDYKEFSSLEINDFRDRDLLVRLIPREAYEKYIKTDISYDELAASGKLLLCGNVYNITYEDTESIMEDRIVKRWKDREGTEYDVLDIDILNTDRIDTLSFTGDYPSKKRKQFSFTEKVEFAGIYTSEYPGYLSAPIDFVAILPIDSTGIGFQQAFREGADTRWGSELTPSFCLTAKEDKKYEAINIVEGLFGDESSAYIMDYITEDTFYENAAKGLKTAGLGFGAALAAVVLLNIYSTISANMINRRRDLSMMRSCGMSMKQVSLSVIIESSFYAGITAVVSSVLGWLLSSGILIFIEESDIDIRLMIQRYPFPFIRALILFAVMMLVMAAAYVPTLISMNRSFIAEEIRTEL